MASGMIRTLHKIAVGMIMLAALLVFGTPAFAHETGQRSDPSIGRYQVSAQTASESGRRQAPPKNADRDNCLSCCTLIHGSLGQCSMVSASIPSHPGVSASPVTEDVFYPSSGNSRPIGYGNLPPTPPPRRAI